MEQLLIEVAKQVPALVVLGWIVWKFLGSLQSQRADFRASLAELHEQVKEDSASSKATQRETNQLIGEVRTGLQQVCEESRATRKVMHETQEVLRASTSRG